MRFTLFAAFGCVLALVRGSSGDSNAVNSLSYDSDWLKNAWGYFNYQYIPENSLPNSNQMPNVEAIFTYYNPSSVPGRIFHIRLDDNADNHRDNGYEILVLRNDVIEIRRVQPNDRWSFAKSGVQKASFPWSTSPQSFWLRLQRDSGLFEFGAGNAIGENLLLTYKDPNPLPVSDLGINIWTSDGDDAAEVADNATLEIKYLTLDDTPNDQGLICCQAVTVQCEACKAGVSPEQYCNENPTSDVCFGAGAIDTDNATTEGCCKAYTVKCMACVEEISEEEYCATHPYGICIQNNTINAYTNTFDLDELELQLQSGEYTQAQVNWILTDSLARYFSESPWSEYFDVASFIAWSNSTNYKIYNDTRFGNFSLYVAPTVGAGIEWIKIGSSITIDLNTVLQILDNGCTNRNALVTNEQKLGCDYAYTILYAVITCFFDSSAPLTESSECSCDSFGCKFPIAPTDQEALTGLPATDESPTPLNSTTTESPTANPTNRPTDSPTGTTESPTADPTNRPTDSPTATTESPTADPTNRPTDSPTTNAQTYSPPSQEPSDGDLRQKTKQGLPPRVPHLEVYYNGSWKPVCDDNFELPFHKEAYENAKVACRQLGLPYQYATAITGIYTGTSDFWLDELYCAGNESLLASCRQSDYGDHNCGQREGVYLMCPLHNPHNSSHNSSNGDLRQEVSQGWLGRDELYLEVYYNGSWRPVCDDDFETVDTYVSPEQAYENAKVACRQLGLPYQYATAISGIETDTEEFWLDNLECTGNESSLASCRRYDYGDHNCNSNEGAYIVCPSHNQTTTATPPTAATPSHNATRTTGTDSNDDKPWSERHWYVYLIAGVVVAAVIVIAIVVNRNKQNGDKTGSPYAYEISIDRLIF